MFMGRLVPVVVVVGTSLLFGCAKKEDDVATDAGEESLTPAIEAFAASKFSPRLVVEDEFGAALAGAKVTFGTMSVTTQADGSAALPEQPRESRTVVTVSATGFAPSTKTLSITNSYSPVVVSLRKYQVFTIDGEAGGSVDVGSTSIRLPGGGFRKADGSPYVGTVTAEVALIFDPLLGGDNFAEGDGFGSAEGSDQAPIQFLGGVSVELKAADGTKLAFGVGERAVVSVLLPGGTTAKAGDTIPLWDLDAATNLWNQVSSCDVQDAAEPQGDRALECVGEVEHFSSVAVGTTPKGGACLNIVWSLAKPLKSGTISDLGVWAARGSWTAQNNPPGPKAPLGSRTLTVAAGDDRPEKILLLAEVRSGAKGTKVTKLPSIEVAVKWEVDFVTVDKIPLADRFDPGGPWKCQQISVVYDPNVMTLQTDNDGDGYLSGTKPGEDCNDNDKTIRPGAKPVICDGKDHDCDGIEDFKKVGRELKMLSDQAWNMFCPQTKASCASALGVEVTGNGRDEDCDGIASDADGDGFFVKGDKLAPAGKDTDCNDRVKISHPGSKEVPGTASRPNYVDEDCDGVAADQDGDGFPSIRQALKEGKSLTTTGVDCNDVDRNAKPGSTVKDLPVLKDYYSGQTRKAKFCELFDKKGQPSAILNYLLFRADRNCNGVLEDLDGDGKLAASAGPFANMPPYDGNDLDPRTQTKGQTGSPNDKECTPAPVLTDFGAGDREVCPRLFNERQDCLDTRVNGVLTGEYVCAPLDYDRYSVTPNPFIFNAQYSPCTEKVLTCNDPKIADPKAQRLLCAGPVKFAPEYSSRLKSDYAKDISKETFTGFCMPVCNLVK